MKTKNSGFRRESDEQHSSDRRAAKQPVVSLDESKVKSATKEASEPQKVRRANSTTRDKSTNLGKGKPAEVTV